MDMGDQRLEIRATNSGHEMIFFQNKGLEVLLMRRPSYTNLVMNIELWAPMQVINSF